MTKTKIQKAFAILAIAGMAFTNLGAPASVFASQIGTGSVVGSGAFDTAINWDDTFPGTASGSVSNIKITARVFPTLNMSISTGSINLGDLVSGTASTGSLFLEIGTNAKDGVSITARSGSGGLTNTSSGAIVINQDVSDGIAGESFTYESIANATDDAASPAFSATGGSAAEVDDNIIEHTVYTTNRPESITGVDDVEFIVSATAVAETPAGDYEDTVIFTVTGNF